MWKELNVSSVRKDSCIKRKVETSGENDGATKDFRDEGTLCENGAGILKKKKKNICARVRFLKGLLTPSDSQIHPPSWYNC